MRRDLCLCHEARALKQSLRLESRVTVLCHYKEFRRTTNTGRLAKLCLPESSLLLRGQECIEKDLKNRLALPQRPLFLFPSEDALLLESLNQEEGPFHLIVPDGNWRQAAKVASREKLLQGVPRVALREGPPTRYRLRSEPRPGGLATFEAIARAIGVLESEAVQKRLEALFDLMVERTLRSRLGILPSSVAKKSEEAAV